MTLSRKRAADAIAAASASQSIGSLPLRLPFCDAADSIAVAHELREVEGAEVARFVREERLLAARIRRFDGPELRRRVVAVDAVDEDEARVAVLPGVLDDAPEDGAGVALASRPRRCAG